MQDIAFLIQGNHFDIEEVDFKQIKENFTNNIILDFNSMTTNQFKRSLFECDRLNINIGVLILDDTDSSGMIKLLESMRGFDINLGVWIQKNKDTDLYYNILKERYYNNFIIGIRFLNKSDFDNFSLIVPSWVSKGDLEDYSFILPDFIHKTIKTIKINTDYAKLYKENNLSPIKSNQKIIINFE